MAWGVVLGCSVGSGAAVVEALALKSGLDVVGLHRGNHPEEAGALRATVGAAGRRFVEVVADAGRPDAIHELAGRVQDVTGRGAVRICVHSLADASVGLVVSEEPRRQLHPRQIIKTFDTMAHSFLYWGQELHHRGLMEPGGQLLALLNFLDQFTARGFCAIGASKAALGAYVRYMGAELAPAMRVNALRFGAAKTFAFARMPNSDAALQRLAGVNPMGRVTRVEDVGDFVSLMTDPRCAWLNGATVDFDGGEMAQLAESMFQTGL